MRTHIYYAYICLKICNEQVLGSLDTHSRPCLKNSDNISIRSKKITRLGQVAMGAQAQKIVS